MVLQVLELRAILNQRDCIIPGKPSYGINLARPQCRQTRRKVRNDDKLEAVQVGHGILWIYGMLAPVVRIPDQGRRTPRNIVNQHEWPRPTGVLPVVYVTVHLDHLMWYDKAVIAADT